jgi:hypothetical protein
MFFIIVTCIEVMGGAAPIQHDRGSVPKVVFKPDIVLPDSLLHVKGCVKILVRIEVDSSGRPLNGSIVSSTNKRFNALALGHALEYRFAPAGDSLGWWSKFVLIPFTVGEKAKKN